MGKCRFSFMSFRSVALVIKQFLHRPDFYLFYFYLLKVKFYGDTVKNESARAKKLGGAPNSPPQLFRVKSEILTKKSGFGGWKYRADKGLKDTVVN